MTDSLPTPASKQNHLPWLDGLRGLAAFWVLASHVQILSGLRDLPLLSWGGIAVDLFMLLSGFLMAHNYLLRQQAEPWGETRTFVLFWLRRFFRIAPLYYLLLIVAVGIGGMLADDRSAIAAIWPNTATPLRRYLDGSFANYLAHFSFAFGFLPDYAFRTALPDWSIGLEMQFYLVFPFVMLAVLRLGAYAATFGALALCLGLWFLFPGYFASFEMPAFIAMKLCVFMAGMWIALGRRDGKMTRALIAALAMLLVWALAARHFHLGEPRVMTLCRFAIAIAMFYLMNDGSLPGSAWLARPLAFLRAWLAGRVARFLGDTSYCTYLLHLLILLPVAGTLAAHPGYVALPSPLRFLLCLALVLPPVYLISWALFRTVETYGIHLGRQAVKAIARWRPGAAGRVHPDVG